MSRVADAPIRVLMLGWEYPPRYAGGLGKACRGLSVGMSRHGAQVYFVLPTFPERISEPSLEVVGARETLIQAGWTSSKVDSMAIEVTTIRTEAMLYPYGVNPDGPAPESIRRAVFGGAEMKKEGGTPVEAGVPANVDSPTRTAVGSKAAGHTPGSNEIYGKNLWSEIERYCFAVRQMASSHDVDVIHAHDWMTFPAAFEAQRITGAPVFLHVHATEYDRAGENVSNEVFRIEREGFRRATHIFAVSRYTAGIIERLYGVNRKKISVIYNAPDEDAKTLTTDPDAAREPNVVFLGRLTYQKGPDHFLRAAQLVTQAMPEARFLFCGTGDMFDKLRAMTHKLGLEEKVHFAGFVDPAGVDEILSSSRVLVMPSVSEPFGLVALEAIHCGIPVILSKQSGVREVMSRALQVDFWDHERLADQILAALRLPELSKQLVDEGMEQVKKLSWEKSAQKVIHSYRQKLERTAHGH